LKGIWAVSVIASILILGTIGLSQDVIAQSFSFSIPLGEPALTEASSIAFDNAGNFYLTQSVLQLHQVAKFSSTGDEIWRIGTEGSGPSEFNFPSGIDVSNSDKVYVAESLNNRIQIFDSDGNFISFIDGGGCFLSFPVNCVDPDGAGGPLQLGDGQFSRPQDVAVDSSENVYVVDQPNSRIVKFDSNGNFLLNFGTSGTGDGQFTTPQGIGIDNLDFVYVVSRHNVQKFDASGSFLLKFGSLGSGNGQFSSPWDVNVDGNGNIIVADSGNNRIQKFGSIGNFLLKFGSNNSSDPAFIGFFQLGVATDQANNIFVPEGRFGFVKKFNENGIPLVKFGTFGLELGKFFATGEIQVDQLGNVFVYDIIGRIQKFDPIGNFVLSFGTSGKGDGEFQEVSGIEVASNNDIFVADRQQNRMQKFDQLGDFQSKFGSRCVLLSPSQTGCVDPDGAGGPLELGDGQFHFLTGTTIDSFDNIVAVDLGNARVQIFDSNGNFLDKFGTQCSVSFPVITPDCVDPDGAGSLDFGDGQFFSPTDVVIDSLGNFYVSDTGNQRIQKFDSNFNFLGKFGNLGSGEGEFLNPTVMVIDGSDVLRVLDTGNFRIQTFDTDGDFLSAFDLSSKGAGQGQFLFGSNFDVNEGSDLYISDRFNARVQVFLIPTADSDDDDEDDDEDDEDDDEDDEDDDEDDEDDDDDDD